MGLVLWLLNVYSFYQNATTFHRKAGHMVTKLAVLLFTFGFVFPPSMPGFAQEGSKQEEAKETAAQEKAEHHKTAKQARWTGIIVRSDKDGSTLSVRKSASSTERTIHYDSSTRWTTQEHGKVKDIDASEVKDGDRVI